MGRSKTVAIEFALSWDSANASHVDRYYLPDIDLWGDSFPGSLGERLSSPGDERGPQEDFEAGVLVEPYRDVNVRTVRRDQLAAEFRRHVLGPLRLGRFYPRGIGAGALSAILPHETLPLRVIATDGDRVTVDLNHPLARFPLALSARVDEEQGVREDRARPCHHIAQVVTAAGPGMQAMLNETPTDFLDERSFVRDDEADDRLFYQAPRLVDHLDAVARGRVSEIYGRFIHTGFRVLDLMSSWNSHLPTQTEDLHVTGVGMNREELAQNPRLTERVVQDINRGVELPFRDARFDAAICTVSVEYLTRPVEIFREVARSLRPGAPFVLTFSERWFPPKVIKLWTQLHPFERMGLVIGYLMRSKAFEDLGTETIRGLWRPADDKYAAIMQHSDPIYAVWGYRRRD